MTAADTLTVKLSLCDMMCSPSFAPLASVSCCRDRSADHPSSNALRREDPPRGACGNVRRVPEAPFGLPS
jgi:hypothetical protein